MLLLFVCLNILSLQSIVWSGLLACPLRLSYPVRWHGYYVTTVLHCFISLLRFYAAAVPWLVSHRACTSSTLQSTSLGKNQHGHWVSWMSMAGKNKTVYLYDANYIIACRTQKHDIYVVWGQSAKWHARIKERFDAINASMACDENLLPLVLVLPYIPATFFVGTNQLEFVCWNNSTNESPNRKKAVFFCKISACSGSCSDLTWNIVYTRCCLQQQL